MCVCVCVCEYLSMLEVLLITKFHPILRIQKKKKKYIYIYIHYFYSRERIPP